MTKVHYVLSIRPTDFDSSILVWHIKTSIGWMKLEVWLNCRKSDVTVLSLKN